MGVAVKLNQDKQLPQARVDIAPGSSAAAIGLRLSSVLRNGLQVRSNRRFERSVPACDEVR
jgi:hypothetical protein